MPEKFCAEHYEVLGRLLVHASGKSPKEVLGDLLSKLDRDDDEVIYQVYQWSFWTKHQGNLSRYKPQDHDAVGVRLLDAEKALRADGVDVR